MWHFTKGHKKEQNARFVQLKTFADNKLNITGILRFVLILELKGRKHYEKRESPGNQHLLCFPPCFKLLKKEI